MLIALDMSERMLDNTQVIPKQSSLVSSVLLLATHCIVTTRGYRALVLHIHIGPSRLAVKIQSDPGHPGDPDVVSCRSLEDHNILVFTREAICVGGQMRGRPVVSSRGDFFSVLGDIGYWRLLLQRQAARFVSREDRSRNLNSVKTPVLRSSNIQGWSISKPAPRSRG
jgi:hypothetical protein